MEWSLIYELIDPALLIVIGACWVLGMILKQTPGVPNWTIVYILTAFAILLTFGLVGLSIEAAVQGLLCGALSVYGHQVVKQTRERE